MLSASRRRGYDAERRLVKLLSKRPTAYVIRVPVSGSRAPPDGRVALPDVFMVDNARNEIVAFEVKATSGRRVTVRAEQLVKLFKFLDAFKRYEKRYAVVAVWFASEGKWVFKRVRETFPPSSVVISCEEESDWQP